MKAYSIFDDLSEYAQKVIRDAGVELELHPRGIPRPSGEALRTLLETYDALILGTGQKLPDEFFANVASPKVVVTASIGIDHIRIPEDKRGLVRIVNAPTAIFSTVAEHTFALFLALSKRLPEARRVAAKGLHKKAMSRNPSDLSGATLGIIGCGGIGRAIGRLGEAFGMRPVYWTAHPERHPEIAVSRFLSIDELLCSAPFIAVALPAVAATRDFISAERVAAMRADAVFVSISRAGVVNTDALLARAAAEPHFRVGLDVDAETVAGKWGESSPNIIVTPHIGGGTVESRVRLFNECCERFSEYLKSR